MYRRKAFRAYLLTRSAQSNVIIFKQTNEFARIVVDSQSPDTKQTGLPARGRTWGLVATAPGSDAPFTTKHSGKGYLGIGVLSSVWKQMPQGASFLVKAWLVNAIFTLFHHICVFLDFDFVSHDLVCPKIRDPS